MILPYAYALAIVVATSFICHAQQLPDDSAKYSIITITSEVPTSADAALIQSLASDPSLMPTARACNRFDFSPRDAIYLARYAASIPPINLPIIALVRSDGGVIYKKSGAAIPAPKDLAIELEAMAIADRIANPRPIPTSPLVQADCPDGNCPLVDPKPILPPARPLPRPFDGRIVDGVIPDTITVSPQVSLFGETSETTIAIIAAVAIVSLLGFVGVIVLIGAVILFIQ